MDLLKDLGAFGLLTTLVAYAVKVYWDGYTVRRQFVSAALTECLQMFHGVLGRLAHPEALRLAGLEHSSSMPGPYLLTADVVRNIPDQVIHHGMLQVRSSYDGLERVEARLREKGLDDSPRTTLLFERAALTCELAFALVRTAELLCDKKRTQLFFGGNRQMLEFVADLHRLDRQSIHGIVEALRPAVRHLGKQSGERWPLSSDLDEFEQVLRPALERAREFRRSRT